MRKIDLTGQKFGRLTVIREHEARIKNKIIWVCRCDCGNTVKIIGDNLKSGCSTSCGCYFREIVRNTGRKNKKHGMTDTRLFNVRQGIKNRVGKSRGYEDVCLCDEWKTFEPFYKWAMMTGYDETAPKGKCTIDRIDPYGDYCPENCRWIDTAMQNRNKRNTRIIYLNGERHSTRELSKKLGKHKDYVYIRLKNGMPVEDIIEEALRN
jgi:hypothetical protein